MERIYIQEDNAKITKAEGNLLDVEMYDGRKFKGLEARRLFPISGLDKYISLLDEEDIEIAVIRDVRTLMPESRQNVVDVLNEYYLIPQISEIYKAYEEYGLLKMEVMTDRGKYNFDVKNRNMDIKILYDGRILIKDASDNRYEIPDVSKLDKKSIKMIMPKL